MHGIFRYEETQEDNVGLLQQSVWVSGHSNDAVLPLGSEIPCGSLTDEFLQAVEAARQANQQEPAPLDPMSIDAQPTAFHEIWDRISIQMDVSALPVPENYRIELSASHNISKVSRLANHSVVS